MRTIDGLRSRGSGKLRQRGGRRCVPGALAGGVLLLLASAGAAEEAAGAGKGEGGAVPVDIDAQYVEEHLKDYLHPTRVEFHPDGRITLFFDFRKKDPAHASIFTPAVGKDTREKFRWTVAGEDYRYTYYEGNDRTVYLRGGLKIGDAGMALLNCWFKDEVKAEAEYVTHVNYSPRQRAALIFCTDKGLGVGSNFGSQCMTLNRGRAKPVAGAVEPLVIRTALKVGFELRGGNFEALKEGRKMASASYPQKSFASGRIGFHWAGTVSGVFRTLEITGKLDAKRMAQEIRKQRGRRR